MKLSLSTLTLLFVVLAACQKTDRSRLVGTWRIADMRFEYLERQKEFMQSQIQSLTDSIAKTSDSLQTANFTEQLKAVQGRADELQANVDSMYKNIWTFRNDGTFEAEEVGGSRSGIWSYDPIHQRLFTVIDDQTASVTVRFSADTMVLQLDSNNYMSFVPVN